MPAPRFLPCPTLLADPQAVGPVRQERSLACLTKYRLGGPAQWFAEPQSLSQLAELIARCRSEHVPLRILGGGANLLVDDEGVSGVVVRLSAPCFTRVDWQTHTPNVLRKDAPVLVRAGAGADMARLSLRAVRRGLTGLECMAGIPGSVGGCIRMNAGGRWGQIGNVVRQVTILEPSGRLCTLAPEQIGFGYRHTRLDGAVVCDALLELLPGDPPEIQRRYREIWRAKKKGQPLAAHSAGCVFKNPPGDSAGRLIDAAGLKNRAVGGAVVSPEHANFIVARQGGTARDVLQLINVVRRAVAERFSIELELEIEVWHRGSRHLQIPDHSGLSGTDGPAIIPAGRMPVDSETEFPMTLLARQRSSGVPQKRKAPQALAVTVLSGGPSNEREVSLKSGRAVAGALESVGHKVVICDVSPNDLQALDIPADLVFIALHGTFGEDGSLQHLLAARKIRYTGSGAASSALAMDKVATKCRFVEAEVPTPRFDVVTADRLTRVVEVWPLPVVVKPVAEGSSIDIQIVRDADTLRTVLQRMTRQYNRCLVEAFIDGYELTVGILGDQALPPIEIRTRREFYNYEAKYLDDDTEYRFDIDLPSSVIAEVQSVSLRAHQALGCRHFSRVDWLVDRRTHQPYALEVNTIPGFTDHSLLPKAAARAGLDFPQLCQRIVELAFED